MQKTIGVIGLGSIGFRHSLNIEELGHKVIAYDPNPKIEYSEKLAIAGSVEEALREVDGVVIASPTAFHFEQLDAALIYGKPIFVEKPIAATNGELESLRLGDHGELDNVIVGYNLRFHECVKEAKLWIADEAPVWAYFTCAQRNNKPDYLRDGVILNWSHEIDLALYLLGPATVVSSSTRVNEGRDDITDILLVHDNGCRTTIHLDYVTEPEERHFTIQCQGVRLKADLVNNVLAEISEAGTIDVENYPNTFDDNYIEEMKAFISLIDGKRTFACTGEEALKVLEICFKVREQAGLP